MADGHIYLQDEIHGSTSIRIHKAISLATLASVAGFTLHPVRHFFARKVDLHTDTTVEAIHENVQLNVSNVATCKSVVR